MTYAYVFGPVASSRLGRSLGLDLLGRRICSMDCLYCEVGPTDILTLERAPWVPAAVLLDELARWAAENGDRPDHVTLGGSGEPCLNSEIAEVIAGCRRILPGVPVAVLTNATLLDRADVRADISGADVVLPSLDSLVESEFRRVNRTCCGLTARAVAEGIRSFASGFSGRIWLEVLLVAGVNDSAENLALMRDYVRRLAPDRVDVTTLSRPGTWPDARPVDRATLAAWRAELQPLAQATGAATADMPQGGLNAPEAECPRQGEAAGRPVDGDLAEAMAVSLRRRPQTAGQLARALAQPHEDARIALEALARAGRIRPVEGALTHDDTGEVFWTAVDVHTGE